MGEVVKDSSVMHVVSHYCVVDEVVEHPLGGLNDRFHGKTYRQLLCLVKRIWNYLSLTVRFVRECMG